MFKMMTAPKKLKFHFQRATACSCTVGRVFFDKIYRSNIEGGVYPF